MRMGVGGRGSGMGGHAFNCRRAYISPPPVFVVVGFRTGIGGVGGVTRFSSLCVVFVVVVDLCLLPVCLLSIMLLCIEYKRQKTVDKG